MGSLVCELEEIFVFFTDKNQDQYELSLIKSLWCQKSADQVRFEEAT
jgi:hypothetical protein